MNQGGDDLAIKMAACKKKFQVRQRKYHNALYTLSK